MAAMPLPIIPGTVRAAFIGQVPSGQAWVNVLHCRYSGGASSPGPTEITALHNILIRFYSGASYGAGFAWLANCHTAVKLNTVRYTPLDNVSLTTEFNPAAAGLGSTASTPSECAPVVTLRTAHRGRSYRGRIYLPCPTNGAVGTDGRLNSSIATGTLTQLNGVMSALGGASTTPFWEIGVASYLLSHFEPLTTPTFNLDVDVQRRRKS